MNATLAGGGAGAGLVAVARAGSGGGESAEQREGRERADGEAQPHRVQAHLERGNVFLVGDRVYGGADLSGLRRGGGHPVAERRVGGVGRDRHRRTAGPSDRGGGVLRPVEVPVDAEDRVVGVGQRSGAGSADAATSTGDHRHGRYAAGLPPVPPMPHQGWS